MDLGRLVATLQLVGAKAAANDLKQVDTALDSTAAKAEAAGQATDKLADAQDKASDSSQKSAEKTLTAAQAKKQAEKAAQEQAAAEEAAAEKIGRALAITGTAILAMVGTAVSKYAEFDQAMSGVQATVQGSIEVQNRLRDAAIEAGSSTAFSATEAANAQNELAKAGVGVNDILSGGLAGSLALAAAGQLGVADAAEIAATALVQFNLEGSQVPHVADLLAAGAGKAQGSVGDLSQALKQSGLVASQMGLSIEETTGTLAAFASAGLLGSDAGTSFRTMLLALANPSTVAQKALEQYNISAYDANGNMVSMSDLAGQLESKLGNLSQAERDKALATIFGSDAIRAANVLYTQGAGGIASWTEKVNDAGYAAKVAAELQDNLAGDTEKLGGAFDSAFIQSGAAANDVMRDMVQMLTFLVNAYGSLPPGMQQAVVIGGAVVGMLTLTAGAALLAVPKIVEFRAALALIGPAGSGAMGGLKSVASFMLGPWGIAFAAAAVAVGVFVAQQKRIDDATNEISGTLDQATGAMTDYTDATIKKRLADDNVFEAAKRAGVSQDELTAAIRNGGAALDEVKAKLDDTNTIGSFFTGQGIAAGNAKDRIIELAEGVDRAQDRFTQLNDKTSVATSQQEGLADATGGTATSFSDMTIGADDVSEALDGLMESIDEYNKQQQGIVQSNADFLLSLDGLGGEVDNLKESWNQNHDANNQWIQSLDQSTASGAQQAAMLADQAQKAIDSAAAVYEVDKTTMNAKDAADKYSATLASNKDRLIAAATAAGYNEGEVRALLDTIAAAPDQKVTNMVANTAQAKASVDVYVSALNQIPGYKATIIEQVIKQTGAAPGAVGAAYNANGGMYSSASSRGLVKSFADGGFENHVAQYAAGGTYRMWAEDETEGEVYIPMAASKRSRSTKLLEQTADAFGYSLAPAGGTGSMTGMRIAGKLDLGNGFYGYIDAVVQGALTGEADIAAAGSRN